MPNGRNHLEYEDFGKHEYADHGGTSDCNYGCGCWMGPARSKGPTGVDPFGRCPNHPLKKVEGYSTSELDEKERLADLVNSRIAYLEEKILDLKPYKLLVDKAKKSSKIDLQKRLNVGRKLNSSLNNKVNKIIEQLQSILNTMV